MLNEKKKTINFEIVATIIIIITMTKQTPLKCKKRERVAIRYVQTQ